MADNEINPLLTIYEIWYKLYKKLDGQWHEMTHHLFYNLKLKVTTQQKNHSDIFKGFPNGY